MSYWNGSETVRIEDKPYPNYPNWQLIDCGCCAGIEWGGDYPKECLSCEGRGFLARHIKSGVLAHYPGGPFVGREKKK